MKRSFDAADIQRRCLCAMANEGARLVEDGVVLRPSDIDVVAILGLGFPHWRGGPMMAADLHGLLAVENEIRSFAGQAPQFWAPAPLFDELIKNGLDFASLNQV